MQKPQLARTLGALSIPERINEAISLIQRAVGENYEDNLLLVKAQGILEKVADQIDTEGGG